MDSSIFTHNEFLRQQRSSLKSWQLGQNIEDFDASNEGESAPVITSTSTSCNRILGAFATFSKIPMLDHIPD
ncbi:MAG: hypothetical protein ABIV51_05250, partial [Saprospiraceae bacterium]